MLFLGSYPPRACGIATFTKDVVDSYDQRYRTKSEIIAIDEPDAPARSYPPEVLTQLIQDDHDSYREIAEVVNAHPCDALNVQHEYGLFGGDHGEWIVDSSPTCASRQSFRCAPCRIRRLSICALRVHCAQRPRPSSSLAPAKTFRRNLPTRRDPRHPCGVPKFRSAKPARSDGVRHRRPQRYFDLRADQPRQRPEYAIEAIRDVARHDRARLPDPERIRHCAAARRISRVAEQAHR